MHELLKRGLVSVELVKKDIAFVDQKTGEEVQAAVYVRPLSFASVTADLKNHGGSEDEAVARRIALSICDEDGKQIFDIDQISGVNGVALSGSLTFELLRVIGEVNELGKMEA